MPFATYEPIVHSFSMHNGVRALDRNATAISLLIVIVCAPMSKKCCCVKSMAESPKPAQRTIHLIAALRRPELLIVIPILEIHPPSNTCRATLHVHKHRNLLRMHPSVCMNQPDYTT